MCVAGGSGRWFANCVLGQRTEPRSRTKTFAPITLLSASMLPLQCGHYTHTKHPCSSDTNGVVIVGGKESYVYYAVCIDRLVRYETQGRVTVGGREQGGGVHIIPTSAVRTAAVRLFRLLSGGRSQCLACRSRLALCLLLL
ncbi:unnamed protein product [Danaus chrysippus]|uniref:(African queen) hypothetical protein n=1 Tax=Danaus chrysippus TaxID=151541 RepID=A0A8J2QEJ9_9NEOP|nr:unnamed protein product [Danaus chrysippus]